jgi:hypothetical protein
MICQNADAAVFSGRIAIIDIPNRNVVLRIPGGEMFEFNVGPACRVILNGEPVRLRLLLTGDEVEIAYSDREGHLTASSITVRTRQRNRP